MKNYVNYTFCLLHDIDNDGNFSVVKIEDSTCYDKTLSRFRGMMRRSKVAQRLDVEFERKGYYIYVCYNKKANSRVLFSRKVKTKV
jgi:hypothetical protein